MCKREDRIDNLVEAREILPLWKFKDESPELTT
jgi:hypothetical protein